MTEILNVKNLSVEFVTKKEIVNAIADVSLKVYPGEVVGIVGESGSGKSVTASSILRLLPRNSNVKSGRILYEGQNILEMSRKELLNLRGNKISMIFQNPMTSLNPVFTVGSQMNDVIRRHQNKSASEAKKLGIEMFKSVDIPLAEQRYNMYPHEFSGGMRQRVMIAMALACDPDLLIADEPTTALDVSTQSEILKLLIKLKEEHHLSILLITHDLGVIANTCSRVYVMRQGNIIEEGDVNTIFNLEL